LILKEYANNDGVKFRKRNTIRYAIINNTVELTAILKYLGVKMNHTFRLLNDLILPGSGLNKDPLTARYLIFLKT
jgi:hypothetical protein